MREAWQAVQLANELEPMRELGSEMTGQTAWSAMDAEWGGLALPLLGKPWKRRFAALTKEYPQKKIDKR